VAVHTVLGDVELAAKEPLRVGQFPRKHLLERAPPRQQLLGLATPKLLWSIDRLRVEPFIGGETPKLRLALKLGRRPKNPTFSGN
jgi:hypothetical protein